MLIPLVPKLCPEGASFAKDESQWLYYLCSSKYATCPDRSAVNKMVYSQKSPILLSTSNCHWVTQEKNIGFPDTVQMR